MHSFFASEPFGFEAISCRWCTLLFEVPNWMPKKLNFFSLLVKSRRISVVYRIRRGLFLPSSSSRKTIVRFYFCAKIVLEHERHFWLIAPFLLVYVATLCLPFVFLYILRKCCVELWDLSIF